MVAKEMTEAALAEHFRLYRKATRVRFMLLVLTSLANWALWTTIQAGNQKLPAVEEKIKSESANFIKKWGIDDKNTLRRDPNNPNDVAGLIPDVRLPFWMENDSGEKLLEFTVDQQNMESWFDEERLDAYRVPIRLPYLETSLGMNVLLAVDYWPFALITILAVIIVIGMRERSNALMLSWQSFLRPGGLDSTDLLVKSDFKIGRLEELPEGTHKVFVYKRPFIIYPEATLSAILWIGIAYSSIEILSVYDPTHTHPVDDILSDYYAAIWFFGCLTVFFLWLTQRFYYGKVSEALGKPLRARFTHLGFVLIAYIRRWMIHANWRVRAFQFFDTFVALAAIASLFLPWIIEGSKKGFRFLLRQPTVPYEYGEPSRTIRVFPIEPTTFTELRLQLAIAVCFAILCIACSSTWHIMSERWRSNTSRLRLFSGAVVLLLAGNLIFHILTLAIQAQSLGGIPTVQLISSNVGTIGYSMMYLDPAVGLWIFVSVCILLTIHSRFYKSMAAH
jgi:hypothetical protein